MNALVSYKLRIRDMVAEKLGSSHNFAAEEEGTHPSADAGVKDILPGYGILSER